MKKIVMLVMVVFIGIMPSLASAADKTELATQLMKSLGFDAMLESVRTDAGKMVEGQMDGIIVQLRKTYPNIPDSVMKQFRVSGQELNRRIINSWSSTEAAKIYSATLIDGLPENDMRAAIEHYTAAAGQRELKTINDAVKKTNAYIMGSIQRETEGAMNDFLNEIRSSVEKARSGQVK